MSVFVCGSLHYDVVVDAPHLPRLDETVAGGAVHYVMGGKGGNQACAAARMGAVTAFAGCVGSDAFAGQLLDGLRHAGVDTAQIARDPGPSGMSVAIVEPDGGYGAVIVSAANLKIDARQIQIPAGATIVLLQNEIPEAVNLAVALKARAQGAEVVLNAAPARSMPPDLLAAIAVLVVNRVEAADLLKADEAILDPLAAVRALTALGPRAVIVTMGGDGLALCEAATVTALAAHRVAVISTHGAGDAFLGALAAARADGQTLAQAAAFGQAAAALHVATPVDQRGAITRRDVAELMAQTEIR